LIVATKVYEKTRLVGKLTYMHYTKGLTRKPFNNFFHSNNIYAMINERKIIRFTSKENSKRNDIFLQRMIKSDEF